MSMTQSNPTKIEQHSEIVIAIDGMSCLSCVEHIETALKGVAGVIDVSVQLKEKRAKVRFFRSPAMEARLIGAILDAGYDAHVSHDACEIDGASAGACRKGCHHEH